MMESLDSNTNRPEYLNIEKDRYNQAKVINQEDIYDILGNTFLIIDSIEYFHSQ